MKISDFTPTEGTEQAALFNWAAMRRGRWPELDLMFHIPNEGLRSKTTGAKMAKEGMKSGVPDIFLPVPRSVYHGLFVEMKRTKYGKATANQHRWLQELQLKGYACAICFGWVEASKVIENYLNGETITYCEF